MRNNLVTILLLSFLSLTSLAEHDAPVTHKVAPAEDVDPIIQSLQSVVCDPEELFRYLQQAAIEDDSAAMKKLDNDLRKTYQFDKQELTPADHEKLVGAAVMGTRTIRNQFQTRWTTVTSRLLTESHPDMQALAPALETHIDVVVKEYDRLIENMEFLKPEVGKFTGLGCATCNVGYQPLRVGLKKSGLARGRKKSKIDCPQSASFNGREAEFDGKKYTVAIKAPNGTDLGGEVFLTEIGKKDARPLELPKELLLLKAIDKYYDDNAPSFIKASPAAKLQIKSLNDYVDRLAAADPAKVLEKLLSELKEKKTQREKFEHMVQRLADFERSPGLGSLKDYMEKLKADSARETERTQLMVDLGIPLKAILKSDKVNNRWSHGYTVDYSKFEGGPARNQNADNSILAHVKNKLGGPSKDANHVLLNLTDACFYCDAALWQQLQFP